MNKFSLGLAAALTAVFLFACSGGMTETESDELSTGGGRPEATTEANEESQDSSSASSNTNEAAATPTGPTTPTSPDSNDSDVLAALRANILGGWTQPGRDPNALPRSGRAIINFDSSGQVTGWRWRRRSSDGWFNTQVETFLSGLVDSSATFSLPRDGSSERDDILSSGLDLEFADDDF